MYYMSLVKVHLIDNQYMKEKCSNIMEKKRTVCIFIGNTDARLAYKDRLAITDLFVLVVS